MNCVRANICRSLPPQTEDYDPEEQGGEYVDPADLGASTFNNPVDFDFVYGNRILVADKDISKVFFAESKSPAP